MATFLQANRDLVIGGAARFLYQQTAAEHGSAVSFPTKIQDVINTTSYKAVIQNGWVDFSQTSDGITISRALSKTTWDTDQVSEVHDAVDRWTHTLSTNLAEISLENLVAAWEGGDIHNVSGGLAGERYLEIGVPSTLKERRLAVIFMDHHGYYWLWAFRRAKLEAAGDTAYTRAGMQVLPTSFKLFPDPDVEDEYDQIGRLFTTRPATTTTSTSTTSTTTTTTTA